MRDLHSTNWCTNLSSTESNTPSQKQTNSYHYFFFSIIFFKKSVDNQTPRTLSRRLRSNSLVVWLLISFTSLAGYFSCERFIDFDMAFRRGRGFSWEDAAGEEALAESEMQGESGATVEDCWDEEDEERWISTEWGGLLEDCWNLKSTRTKLSYRFGVERKEGMAMDDIDQSEHTHAHIDLMHINP